MADNYAIVGIDGGGTSTKAIAMTSDGSKIGTSIAGPSNPNNSSFKQSARSIIESIEIALGSSSLPLNSLCLGIAGVASQDQRNALQSALFAQQPSLKNSAILITHDLEIAHQACFSGSPGLILIAGTGSACYAKSESGAEFRVSGRSGERDDPGSGYAIGKQFRAANQLKANPSRELIAALAEQVIELAEDGNGNALQILKSEADRLVSLTESIPLNVPVALVGGIVEPDTIYRKLVIEALEKRFGSLQMVVSKRSPKIGALQLAWQLIGSEPFDSSKL